MHCGQQSYWSYFCTTLAMQAGHFGSAHCTAGQLTPRQGASQRGQQSVLLVLLGVMICCGGGQVCVLSEPGVTEHGTPSGETRVGELSARAL